MSSIIKVDTIKDIASTDIIKKSGTSITVGTASDTTTVAGNAVRSNAIQAADGQNIISQVGSTITLGATGDTVEIATGATLVGGGIAWQSSIVTAATLTAVAGRGYWIDTSSNACTITLPGSASVGDRLIFTDYLRTWGSNSVTLNINSLKFQGGTANAVYNTSGQSVDLVYSGATQGWIPNSDDDVSDESIVQYSVDYLVVAGGGSGGRGNSGGGGAGGLLTNMGGTPIIFVPNTVYTIQVGDGGNGPSGSGVGVNGSNSVLSGGLITTVTAIGGGGGGGSSTIAANNGGSGGGGPYNLAIGKGSGTVGQGNDGGQNQSGPPEYGGSGGGGAGSTGFDGEDNNGGNGGVGLSNSITGSAVFYAGGGGGSVDLNNSNGGIGGNGGGGNGSRTIQYNGTDGLGGGGGGVHTSVNSGNGGSGVVILSMPDAAYSGATTGNPTVTTGVSGKTILTFTGSGSYTG